MRKWIRKHLGASLLSRAVLMPYRLWAYSPRLLASAGRTIAWLLGSNEHSNFTYELSPLNSRHLASLIGVITGRPIAEIRGYMDELVADKELHAQLSQVIRERRDPLADSHIRYGSRIGFYALVRALKPKLVLETGVDKGLATAVLAKALKVNTLEGAPGRLYGVDINADAGYLLSGDLLDTGELVVGDAHEFLLKLEGRIDLYICTTHVSAAFEKREYEIIREKLAQDSVILTDFALGSDTLCSFAAETGRDFLAFTEEPRGHCYRGCTFGFAFRLPGCGSR